MKESLGIFVKGYGFSSFAKNKSKNLSQIYSQKQIILNNLLQMNLKLLQRKQFKKQQKQLVI